VIEDLERAAEATLPERPEDLVAAPDALPCLNEAH
jgi:hypothetical protein